MKKQLLIVFLFVLGFTQMNAQTDKLWSPVKGNVEARETALRETFPTEFRLFKLNLASMKEILFTAKDRFVSKKSAIITLPNTDGVLEQFEVLEASNFTKELQAQFPEIRAYVGKSLTDKYATLRLSISPQGISTMVFRTERRNEFMEAYSVDGKVYAVYNSSRNKGSLPFTCSTKEMTLAKNLSEKTSGSSTNRSSASELLTFRLALSCTGEYGVAFGGAVGALAQMNATMTRVNGVFEKDFTIHMSMIPNAAIIYTDAATDPYSPSANMANWNAELQATLTSVIGEANYDIGHLFGASGGGGNAGCIGCVCDDGQKGSGITSPGSGLASGDTFDIDYVAHEMGHQFGANHTFSMSNEGSGVNFEPGSGSTIMGYAGITAQDVQPNSDDYFHYASIFQVEDNMLAKTCPTRTSIANLAPVVNAGLSYTIPKSTPFILTGSATDPNGNPLTYCWEQIDSGTGAATDIGTQSNARANKAAGPNWRSYLPTTSPSRYFPRIQSVIANSATTTGTEITVEALSSVSRTLTFALTARDNVAGAGLTNTDAMVVTVNAAAGVGPFAVTVPNTAVSYAVGTNQTVTWGVAGTTANNINAANVDIYLSTDGGNTYPILLASKVPNDGSQIVTIPNNVGTTNRIMVKGNNHIFFDISNVNFTITAATNSFAVAYDGTVDGQRKTVCQGTNVVYNIQYNAYAGFAGTTTFVATGLPVGAIATFSPTSISANGTVTMTISNTNASPIGLSSINVAATSGTTKNVSFYLDLLSSAFGVQALTSPANLATAQSTSPLLTWPANSAASSYDVQVATDAAFTNIIISGTVTGTSASISGLTDATDYYWRVMPKNAGCSGTFSSGFKFTTGQSNCTYNYSNNANLAIADGTGANVAGAVATKTIVVPGTVAGNLNSVEVDLSFTHDYVQDLVIELVHPDGTIVKLMNRNCDEGASVVGATYSFHFTNTASAQLPAGSCLTPAPITGNVKPADPITVFNGRPAAGTWTLRAADWYNGDTGSISNWSINLCVAELPLSNPDFELNDLNLFPNPNKGDFTVRFTSASTNDIKINVHDMRGRQVYEKSFSNTGAFNQNINLNKVEAGIYLVSIIDGDKKTVKRIVVE